MTVGCLDSRTTFDDDNVLFGLVTNGVKEVLLCLLESLLTSTNYTTHLSLLGTSEHVTEHTTDSIHQTFVIHWGWSLDWSRSRDLGQVLRTGQNQSLLLLKSVGGRTTTFDVVGGTDHITTVQGGSQVTVGTDRSVGSIVTQRQRPAFCWVLILFQYFIFSE